MAFFLCILLQASLLTVHTYLISPDKIGLSITIPTMWISGKCQIESLSMITCEYLVHRFLSLLCSFSLLNCSVRNGVSFWKILLEAALELGIMGTCLLTMPPCLWDAFCQWLSLVSRDLKHPIRTSVSFGLKPQAMISMGKPHQVSVNSNQYW